MFDEYKSRNNILKTLGFETYKSYLESSLWKDIRGRVLFRDKNICQACKKPATVVHHRDYYRPTLDGRHLHGLISLCVQCHEFIEFKNKEKTEKRTFESVQCTLARIIKSKEEITIPIVKFKINHKKLSKKERIKAENRRKFLENKLLQQLKDQRKKEELERLQRLANQAYDAGTKALLGI